MIPILGKAWGNIMWQAKWRHKITGVVFSEYGYDLHDLYRELGKLKEHGHKIISGPYPICDYGD